MSTLVDSGAPLALGSNWPVSSGHPLESIAVGVSRQTAEGDPPGGWTPHERLRSSARCRPTPRGWPIQGFAENVWGRIAVGASADFVRLDRDPRAIPPLRLPAVGVRATYLRGRPAYSVID